MRRTGWRKLIQVLAWAGYAIGGGLVLLTSAELARSIVPYVFDDLGRRYGAMRVLGRTATALSLGVAVLLLCAGLLHHRRIVRLIAALAWIAAAGLSSVTLLLVQRTLEARRGIGPATQPWFDAVTQGELIRCALLSVLLVLAALSAWRASRRWPTAGSAGGD